MTLRLSEDEKAARKEARRINREVNLVSRNGTPVVYRECARIGCGKHYRVIGGSRVKAALSFCSQAHRIEHAKATAFRFSCLVCGVTVFTQPAQIRIRNRKSCSRACAKKIKKQETFERRKSYTRHRLERALRYSTEAKEWRQAVFVRDDYTCQMCGKRGGHIEADHIKPWAHFPTLRFELSNGRTLCRRCHDTTKVGAKKLREMYENQTV